MIYYEYYRFGDADEYKVKEYDEFHYPVLHFHRNYEFIYIFQGRVKVTLDGVDRLLGGGEFLLVFPNQIHAFSALEKTHARVCIFSPKLVNEFYQANQNLYPQKTVTKLSESVERFVLAHLIKGAGKYDVKACLYAVCADIAKQTDFQEQTTPKNFVLVHQLVTYISQNFKSDLSLRSAAKQLGYSYSYLSNYLNGYGLRFPELLRQYRVDYAKYLLKNSSLSVTEIAFECGYNSVRTFNRNFQSTLHLSPKKYRS